MNAKTMIPLVIALVVLTAYLVFQLWAPVTSDSYNRTYSRDIIAQIHVTDIQFAVDLDAISKGYFIANLTIENPTNETLTLGGVHGEYYYLNASTGGGWKIAEGWAWVNSPGVVIPGSSRLALRMELDPWGTGLAPPMIVPSYMFMIYYGLKLRYVSYQMTAIFRDSTIEIQGPAYQSDEIYTLVDTYIFSIVGAWILGFEIVAISLIRKEKTLGTVTMPENTKHSRMFSIIYASQGLGIIAAQGYYQLLYRLIPRGPYVFSPYVGGPAAIAVAFNVIIINIFALLLLIVATGLFFRKNWAGKVAFVISLILVLTSVSAALFALKPLIDQRVLITHSLALTILFSAIAISHAIIIYVFALRKRRI